MSEFISDKTKILQIKNKLRKKASSAFTGKDKQKRNKLTISKINKEKSFVL